MSRVGTLLVVVLLLAGTLVLAPGGVGPVRAAGAASDPVLMAAGDIADCNQPFDEATAALINKVPAATVAMLGDGAYPTGDLATYNRCYGPSWGQFKDRTHPTPGNHDYAVGPKRQSAPDYFDYFGLAAGDPTKGFSGFSS